MTILESFENSLYKKDIINAFKKSWNKRSASIVKDANLNDKGELVENYHYYTCPITGIPHISFNKHYFERLNGLVTKEQFDEYFFDTTEMYQTPFKREAFQKKWDENNSAKKKLKGELGKVVFNNHQFDMDNYYHHYNTTIKPHLIKRKAEIPSTEWVLNYSYFECPLTQLPIMQMATVGHLKALNITKEEFAQIFPDVDMDILQTPKARKYTLQEYYDNKHLTRNKLITEFTPDELNEFKKRYMYIKTKEEYLDIIHNDDYIKNYIRNRKYKIKKEPEIYVHGVEGIDYFTCPVLNVSYVKHNSTSLRNYGITKERLIEWFPEFKFESTSGHGDNISKGQEEIVEGTGKTKRDISSEKSQITRNKKDEYGKSVNDYIGEHTRKTHKNTIDEYGRNGYQRQADNEHGKRIMSKTEGEVTFYDRRARYERIIELVTNRCRLVYKYVGDGSIVWGKFTSKNNPPNAKQLDHKFSRHDGYMQGISPLCVAHFNNIDLVTLTNNVRKGSQSNITLDELATINHMTVREMKDEFDTIMRIIDEDVDNNRIHITMNVLLRAGEHIALKMKPYNELGRACDPDEPDTSIDINGILSSL